jgi:hypothetical protein
MIVTDPQWGKSIPDELRRKLLVLVETGKTIDTDEGKKVEVFEDDLWSLMSFYSRDIRLSNLSSMNGELEYVEYYLNLASDCLRHGLLRSFIKSLSLAVSRMEVSQAKNGFLRKRQGTITQENFDNKEPQKRGIFGLKKGD